MTEQREIDRTDTSGFAHELVACVLLRSGEEEETGFPNAPHRVAAYLVSASAVVILVVLLLVLLTLD
ncbi:hypothetical protein OG455_18205 [Kitasatospora sp. NBC_01287]|uniref:hypothetical protein n=1 Tax=Kitasatospora sp. NBC_01287 TaxID=2903573 RepID=UPI0022584BFF|nr:hypothetical protein [Kitasatospora sp. NBC_01287]MCX4747430.1 hypothetical protein [Kitasatospora sp. NBC_01287]